MNKDHRSDAREIFERKAKDVEILLATITGEIEACLAEDREGHIHYGHVGDVGSYREQLIELLITLRSRDDETEARQEIERQLGKARRQR